MSKRWAPLPRPRGVAAAKHAVISAITASMSLKGMTKTDLAKRMRTSRSLVNRMLDPNQESTIGTLAMAASALGMHLHISISEVTPSLMAQRE